jgi:hypothetical protein
MFSQLIGAATSINTQGYQSFLCKNHLNLRGNTMGKNHSNLLPLLSDGDTTCSFLERALEDLIHQNTHGS